MTVWHWSGSPPNLQDVLDGASNNDVVQIDYGSGAYNFSDQLTVNKKITVRGQAQSGTGSFPTLNFPKNKDGIVVTTGNVVIKNLNLRGIASQIDGEKTSGIWVEQVNNVTISSVDVGNFTNGIYLEGIDGMSTGNVVESPTISFCDMGVLFNQQDGLMISGLQESNGTNFQHAPPHAIYGAGDPGDPNDPIHHPPKLNGVATIVDCASAGHVWDSAFKFKTGTVNIDGLSADACGSLVIFAEGVGGTARNLLLTNQFLPSGADAKAIRIIDGCETLTILGASITADPANTSSLQGVVVADSSKITVMNVTYAFNQTSTATPVPFTANNTDWVNFVDCEYTYNGAGTAVPFALGNYINHGLVLRPTIFGTTNSVSFGSNSADCQAYFTGSTFSCSGQNPPDIRCQQIGELSVLMTSGSLLLSDSQLNKILKVSPPTTGTGAVDVQVPPSPTFAAWVTVRKDDSGGRSIKVTVNATVLATLPSQGAEATVVYTGATWLLVS